MSTVSGPSKPSAPPPTGKGKQPARPTNDVTMNDESESDSDDEQPSNRRDNSKDKVAKPDLFYGDRAKYEAWIIQMDLYFLFGSVPNNKKALFAGTFLRGQAEHWAKPFMKGKLAGTDESGVFDSWENFKRASNSLFGISNEVSVAVRRIQNLRQKGSASEYAATFQENAQLTEWDDTALMEMYRRGLKEEVKDELMRYNGVIMNLGQLIGATIEIDDKLYERRMEKKYDNNGGRKIDVGRPNVQANMGKFRGKPRRHRDQPYYGPQPMELDNIQGKKPGRKNAPGAKKDITCYACNKQGHMARDCRSKNKVHRAQLNVTEIAETKKAVSKVDHGSLNWTACTDDSCLTHFSDKSGAGWFPSNGRGGFQELNAILQVPKSWYPYTPEAGETDDEIEYITDSEEEVSETEEEDDFGEGPSAPPSYIESQKAATRAREILPTISEEKGASLDEDGYSNLDEEDHDIEEYTFAIDGPQPVWDLCRIITTMARKVFPVINGQRQLNVANFEKMLSTMRNHLWDYPLQEDSVPVFRTATLTIPMGSLAMKEGYVTPDGYWISKSWEQTRRTQLLGELSKEFDSQSRNKKEVLTRKKAVERCRRIGGQVSLRWFMGHDEVARPEQLAEERRTRESFLQSIRSEN